MSFNKQAIMGLGTFITKKVSFTTTATTVEVGCEGHRKVIVIGLTHLGDNGANDRLEVDETTDANGIITVDADNEITIQRAASGTSGLSFQITMIGQGG